MNEHIKIKVNKIVQLINGRNWKQNTKEINPIYNDIINITNFLPANRKLNERFYCILNDITSIPLCKTCNENYVKYTNGLDGYRNYCSSKCSATNESTKKQMKDTFIQKYGGIQTKMMREKAKKTCLNKYGTEFATQSNEFKQNRKKTCLKKYGVEEYSLSDDFKSKISDIQKKMKQTCQERYGVDNVIQNKQIKNKWKSSRLDNFYNQVKQEQYENFEFIEEISKYSGRMQKYKWQCKKCNNIFLSDLKDGTRPICLICNPQPRAKTQQKIYEYVNELFKNDIVMLNTKTPLKKFELDIFLPNQKIAIEYNGLYWHSEVSGKKQRKYHLNKTELCYNKNIQLIHIFEDEWLNKQNIVKARLKHILGKTKYKIYGRKCIIKEIDIKLKNKFLNKYHIQGEDKSQVKLGAFYKNRLAAVMTFGKRKITGAKNTEWELIRYTTLSNFNCIGVAGKLLKHFERNWNPEKIITYADRRWSQGNMYKQLGFDLKHISPPNYWYLKQHSYQERFNRLSFQKHKLKDILLSFDHSKSEWDNMFNNEYDRIWDCGNYVFEKTSKRE